MNLPTGQAPVPASPPNQSGVNGHRRALQAVVLAGGPGRLIPPYATPFPKALVPLGDEHAVIEVVLGQLRDQGFTGVTLAVGNLGALVKAYCGDGSRWGLHVDYWWEEHPLGTMGPVVAHLDRLPEDFLVINGDALTDLDCAAFLRDHMRSGAPLSVATTPRRATLDFGVVEVGGRDGSSIVGFREKPVQHLTVSTGVYAVHRETLRGYRQGEPLGFDDLVVDLIGDGRFPRAVPFDGLWLDISQPEEYQRVIENWGELGAQLLSGVAQRREQIV